MLAEYDRSGMTGAQFARFVGARYSTLMYWRQRRRAETGQGEQSATPGIIRVGWKHEWRRSPEVRERRGGYGKRVRCLLATGCRSRWREKFSERSDWAGMLSFSGSLRVFVTVKACDMRKGFGTPRKLDVSRFRPGGPTITDLRVICSPPNRGLGLALSQPNSQNRGRRGGTTSWGWRQSRSSGRGVSHQAKHDEPMNRRTCQI